MVSFESAFNPSDEQDESDLDESKLTLETALEVTTLYGDLADVVALIGLSLAAAFGLESVKVRAALIWKHGNEHARCYYKIYYLHHTKQNKKKMSDFFLGNKLEFFQICTIDHLSLVTSVKLSSTNNVDFGEKTLNSFKL